MFILVFQRNVTLTHKIEGKWHMEKFQWCKGIMTISMMERLYMPEISDTGQSTDTPTYRLI
jgi:hypothetical protein